jgi:hypothetical protein
MAAQRYLVNVDTLECHTRLSPYQIKLTSNVECVFGLDPLPPSPSALWSNLNIPIKLRTRS